MSAQGSLGLHSIGPVVGVVAGKLVAARDGRLSVGRVHLEDVGGVVRVDNGRDVKVGEVGPAVEGELGQHARDVVGTVCVGIVVADPALGNSDGDILAGGHRGVFEVFQAGVGGPDDGTIGVVHGHEGDQVLCGHQGGTGQGGDHCELHFG